MEKMNIPHRLIRLTKMILNETTATVKIKDKLSQEFDFNMGVKQGDGLSTTLFIMALHDAIKNVDQRGAIFTKSSQICKYADDTVIVARSENKLIQVYKNLETYTLKLRLMVNTIKTKYMVLTSTPFKRTHRNLQIEDKIFETVYAFNYLESMITKQNDASKCVQERIRLENKAFYANRKLLNSKFISRSCKMKIYKMLIRPIVTYGSETWILTPEIENALRTFERKIWKIFGPVQDRRGWGIRYIEELEELIKNEDIVRFVKACRISWLGHVERISDYAMPKRISYGKLFSTRKRGRPKNRWIDGVTMDPRKMKVTAWKATIQNRSVWRHVVEETKAHPEL
jgi:hypothetical protein